MHNNYTSHKGNVFFEMLKDPVFMQYRKAWVNNPRMHIVAPFPLHLDIEITNRCNLRCAGCARSTDHWCANGVGDMDINMYKRIIDEGVENGLYSIKLSLRGESMLHHQLFDMIDYALSHGIIDVYFNTNGTFLTDESCQKIIASGMKRISISFDGWDKSSFERYRKGASYDKVMKGTSRLIAAREKAGSKFPKIRMQNVLYPEIKEHLDKFFALFKNKVDEIGSIDAREEGEGIEHKGTFTSTFECPFIWQRMVILYDGTLLPCLMHGVKDVNLLSMGNINDVSIAKQWNSERLHALRQAHIEGRSHEIEACDQCSYRALEIKKINEQKGINR